MPGMPQIPQRPARVAKRVGMRVGTKMLIVKVAAMIFGPGSAIVAFISGCWWIVLVLWVSVIFWVGYVLAVITGIGVFLLSQDGGLAFEVTLGIIGVYTLIMLYAHWRIFRWWWNRLTR